MTCRRRQGFSLLEMIAVMAIVALLATALAPNVLRSIQSAQADAEVATLATLADGIKAYARTFKQLPSPATASWSAAVAQMVEVPEDRIRLNQLGHLRRLYVDPRFVSNTDSTFTGLVQDTGLTARPVSPRMMLVSNLEADADAAPTTSAAFEAIWSQAAVATVIESNTLKIQRIHLADLFHRVLLTNASTVAGTYQLESGTPGSIAGQVGGTDGVLERFVFDSTRLELRAAPFPSNTALGAHLVRAPMSFRYESNDGGITWSWARS